MLFQRFWKDFAVFQNKLPIFSTFFFDLWLFDITKKLCDFEEVNKFF